MAFAWNVDTGAREVQGPPGPTDKLPTGRLGRLETA